MELCRSLGIQKPSTIPSEYTGILMTRVPIIEGIKSEKEKFAGGIQVGASHLWVRALPKSTLSTLSSKILKTMDKKCTSGRIVTPESTFPPSIHQTIPQFLQQI
ncbi:hypothetical protein AGABI2DRAFT_120801 [Agaricus bisporus var. bisporus H97]|uniref:hypothetical protein n=1 Tax=Agaricus bisporus var. bisporus (strain H97 / ATCC MYA-4626 / FGSC 10389) TaxID=936046 RepID=UPI00029F6246|nr:hypothetical protein AGABI2DRAFT_120801 [Agaricus bisporus var. bisporus H97]EKV44676.1 hypothetical protein AGABI2DRAFT_120801 [Agaricus bisporus var. bisporus H97]